MVRPWRVSRSRVGAKHHQGANGCLGTSCGRGYGFIKSAEEEGGSDVGLLKEYRFSIVMGLLSMAMMIVRGW